MKTIVITGCGHDKSLGHQIAVAIREWHDQFFDGICEIIGIDHRWVDIDDIESTVFDDMIEMDAAYPNEALNILGSVDILINCAGTNEISFLEDLKPELFDQIIDCNAKSIFAMSQALLGALTAAKGTIVNIVSNASHMPMTSSLAYNASKGAAHIMTLQMARELTKKNGITVFGISPNKLAGTGMSEYIDQRVVETRGWTPEEAKQYQLNGLVTGEETDPEQLAEFVAFLLSEKDRHKYLSGCILPYGA